MVVLRQNLGKVYRGTELKGTTKKAGCKGSSHADGDGDMIAVESVTLGLKAGEVMGLLGPNGAGKTTTMRIITAEESPTRGGVSPTILNVQLLWNAVY